MRHPGHFGGDGAEGLAFPIRIVGIRLDVSCIFVAKRILPHSDGSVRGRSEGIAEPRIAMFRQPAQAKELSGLLCAEIEPTKLEKFPMMGKPTQIPRFRQDRKGEDGAHAG